MKKQQRTRKKKTIHQFSYKERIQIETYLSEGKSKREIARLLTREPSSIRYEIRHNSVRKRYDAEKAQTKAYQRRWRAQYQVLRVAMQDTLKTYVEHALTQYWSPEAIVGRIRFIDRHIPAVGKDAIYAFIASVHGRRLEQYLWQKGKRRTYRPPRVTIDGRTMIDKRPKYIEKRRSFGHWEGDFIVSGKGGSGALLVLIERKSRYVIIRKLFDRKVSTVNTVLSDIFGSGQLIMDSLTIDNDIAFQKHEEMSHIIGAPIYFCHPYHSWEKGSVEKVNQRIRRFIPKGCDVSKVPIARIQDVERILNNQPQKCLTWETPSEVLMCDNVLRSFVVESTWSRYYEFTNLGWVK